MQEDTKKDVSNTRSETQKSKVIETKSNENKDSNKLDISNTNSDCLSDYSKSLSNIKFNESSLEDNSKTYSYLNLINMMEDSQQKIEIPDHSRSRSEAKAKNNKFEENMNDESEMNQSNSSEKIVKNMPFLMCQPEIVEKQFKKSLHNKSSEDEVETKTTMLKVGRYQKDCNSNNQNSSKNDSSIVISSNDNKSSGKEKTFGSKVKSGDDKRKNKFCQSLESSNSITHTNSILEDKQYPKSKQDSNNNNKNSDHNVNKGYEYEDPTENVTYKVEVNMPNLKPQIPVMIYGMQSQLSGINPNFQYCSPQFYNKIPTYYNPRVPSINYNVYNHNQFCHNNMTQISPNYPYTNSMSNKDSKEHKSQTFPLKISRSNLNYNNLLNPNDKVRSMNPIKRNFPSQTQNNDINYCKKNPSITDISKSELSFHISNFTLKNKLSSESNLNVFSNIQVISQDNRLFFLLMKALNEQLVKDNSSALFLLEQINSNCNLISLCLSENGSSLVILLLEKMNDFEIIFTLIGQSFTSLALSQYGSKLLLEIVDKLETPSSIARFNKLIMVNTIIYVKNKHGSQVICKYLRKFPNKESFFIYELIFQNFLELATDKYGRTIIELGMQSNQQFRINIYNLAIQDSLKLMEDIEGNILLTTLLKENNTEFTYHIYNSLLNNLRYLSKKKHSVKFIQDWLLDSDDEILQHALISKILEQNLLIELLFDQYGNTLIPQILEKTNDESYDIIKCTISPLLNSLSSFPHGLRLIKNLINIEKSFLDHIYDPNFREKLIEM